MEWAVFHIVSCLSELSNSPLKDRYNFSFVTNNNESYFTHFNKDKSLILRFALGVSGQYQAFSWAEAIQQWILYWAKPDECQVYFVCGAFGNCNDKTFPFCTCLRGFEARSLKDWSSKDRSGGCVRKTQLQCVSNSSVSGEEHGFS